MSIQKSVKELIKAINTPKGTEPYDTVAEVVRVDEETAWVHIPGGVDETPVKKTIDAVKGDRVQIRVGGGTAWIVGNESKPPTDDRVANVAQKTAENADLKAILAKKTADEASKVATNYIDFTEEEGLTVGYKDLESKVNISGDGVKLYDEDGNVGTEIKSGFVQVGQSDDGHTTIQEDGMDIYGGNGSINLAHIGYDNGNAQSGQSVAPFYTFGRRASGSGVSVGNYSVAEGYANIASGYASHAGGAEAIASGNCSCAVGNQVSAIGECARAEGDNTNANGICSYARGYAVNANGDYQSAIGKWNVADSVNALVIGNGQDNNSKSNALAIDWDGNARFKGDVYVGCNADSTGGRKVTSQAQGGVATISVNSNSYAGDTITFPTPYASVPLVVAGLAGTITAYGMGSVSVAVYDVTETNFKVRVYNNSSSNRNVTFRWIAIAP